MPIRLWISALTAGTLLVQALAPAWAMAGMTDVQPTPQEQVRPCHDDMGTAPANADSAGHDCCGTDNCTCAATCGGLALPTVSFQPGAKPTASLEARRITIAALPAHRLTPLRPPIASQR